MYHFKKSLPDLVWEKGLPIPGKDPAVFRRDNWGTEMKKTDLDNEQSLYGWCLHHIIPAWEGGKKEPDNLEPLAMHNEVASLRNNLAPWKDDWEFWD